VFWEDTRQPVERGSECRATHTYTLATVHVCNYTNITKVSQKRLEIQALRCNGDTSGRCQHRRHHGILQLRFQLDSDDARAAMSAARISTTILGSMWACTRTSACIASLSSGSPRLRVPRVVVLAGHLLAWVGSRQSIKPVPGCFVDATTCLRINGMKLSWPL
jgi:hypothetical protein